MPTAVSIAGLSAHFVPARELEAREQRERLSTGIAALDDQLGGGWPRGALAEVYAPRGHGRTAVMLASLAAALGRGEAAALVDFDGAFDPRTAARAGVPLQRLLWVRRSASEGSGPPAMELRRRAQVATGTLRLLAAAETVVAAGGFGLLALDFGERVPSIPSSAWLRLRRVAGAPGTVVLAVALRPLPGLLASASVALQQAHPLFAHDGALAPPLLQGVQVQPEIARNLGGGRRAWARHPPLRFGHEL